MFVKEILRKFDRTRYTLTLVNSRPCYIYLPTTVRMAVTDHGKLEDIVIMPYDRLLGDAGTLVVGTVVAIEEKAAGEGGHVILRDGTRLHYDALVLSPGTRLENPLDYPDSKEDIQRYIDECRQKVKDAKHIVFSGGGPTSVGERCESYVRVYSRSDSLQSSRERSKSTFQYVCVSCAPCSGLTSTQDKVTTIVQSRSLPFNDVYRDNFRRRILKECQAFGVDFIFNDYLDQAVPKDGHVTTRNGKAVRADIVVRHRSLSHVRPLLKRLIQITSHGGHPNTEFIQSLGADVLTKYGLVRTNPTLELPGHPGVFCIGDVVDNTERNRLGKYVKHVNTVVPNLLARLNGKEPRKKYKGSFETISISIGSVRFLFVISTTSLMVRPQERGVSYLGILWGICFGNWLTSIFQSRYLAIQAGRWVMGYGWTTGQ